MRNSKREEKKDKDKKPSSGDKKKEKPNSSDKSALDKQKQIEAVFSEWSSSSSNAKSHLKVSKPPKQKKTTVHKVHSTPVIYQNAQQAQEPIPLRFSALKWLINKLTQLNAFVAHGIFRESGHITYVDQIVRSLEKPLDPGKLADLPPSAGIHEYACALKKYLRDAPEPVIPFSDAPTFLSCLEKPEFFLKLFELSQAIATMKPENQLMLRALVFFLKQIVNNADINMMTINNLAISLGPSVLRTSGEMDFQTTGLACEVLALLVANSEDVFAEMQIEEPTDLSPRIGTDTGDTEGSNCTTSTLFSPPAISINKRKALRQSKSLNNIPRDDYNDYTPGKTPETPTHTSPNTVDEEDEDDDDELTDIFEFLGVSCKLDSNQNKKKSDVSLPTLEVPRNKNLAKSTSDNWNGPSLSPKKDGSFSSRR